MEYTESERIIFEKNLLKCVHRFGNNNLSNPYFFTKGVLYSFVLGVCQEDWHKCYCYWKKNISTDYLLLI